MTCIAIIPARGGSQRIRLKNIRPFAGQPIICYSIETAQKSGLFDRIVVTTDHEEIAQVTTHAGAEVVSRPFGLERDEVGTQEVTARTLEQLGITDGLACCIYPCAPLMIVEDLLQAREKMARGDFSPSYAFAVGADPLRDAGMLYFGEAVAFVDRYPLVSPFSVMIPIPEDRCIDINTEADWRQAELLHARIADRGAYAV